MTFYRCDRCRAEIRLSNRRVVKGARGDIYEADLCDACSELYDEIEKTIQADADRRMGEFMKAFRDDAEGRTQ